MKRYRGAGALVLETARASAITVKTDGNATQVRTESGRQFEYRAGRAGCAPLPIERGTE